MNEHPITVRVSQLPKDVAHQIIITLKDEGLSDNYIENLLFVEQKLENPRGLNQIIFDIQGLEIQEDDWDNNINTNVYMGKMKDFQANGKMRQMWGALMQKEAVLYLEKKLEGSGWKLQSGRIIDGREYDCLGWKGKLADNQHPDLAIEMFFPIPRRTSSIYNIPSYFVEHTRQMREKLRKINARHKYVLIGVPQNKTVKTLEIQHPDMQVVYQRHKFGELGLVKRPKRSQ